MTPRYIDPRFISGQFRPAMLHPRALLRNCGVVAPLYPLQTNGFPSQVGPGFYGLPPQERVGLT